MNEKIEELQNKIELLKVKLFNTDYVAIKFAEGEISASEFATVKEQRKMWRAEINACEVMIARLKGE